MGEGRRHRWRRRRLCAKSGASTLSRDYSIATESDNQHNAVGADCSIRLRLSSDNRCAEIEALRDRSSPFPHTQRAESTSEPLPDVSTETRRPIRGRTEQYSGTTFERSRSVSRSSRMLLCLFVTRTRNKPCARGVGSRTQARSVSGYRVESLFAGEQTAGGRKNRAPLSTHAPPAVDTRIERFPFLHKCVVFHSPLTSGRLRGALRCGCASCRRTAATRALSPTW